MQYPKHQNKKRAVTLTELLVVVVIISLLATIAVPVYVNKAEQARIATAIQETRELANAEEQCAIVHGVYVPLQMLDDNPVDTRVASASWSDDVSKEPGSILLILATQPVQGPGAQIQPRLDDGSSIVARKVREGWLGPFMNFQRVAFAFEIQKSVDPYRNSGVSYDYPLDPWGNPYYLYSPLGLVGTNAYDQNWGSVNNYNSLFSDGKIRSDDPRFDRFAVVSYGPNRRRDPDSDPRDKDDIYHLFGGVFSESSFQALFR